jgi:hypothetical protein
MIDFKKNPDIGILLNYFKLSNISSRAKPLSMYLNLLAAGLGRCHRRFSLPGVEPR